MAKVTLASDDLRACRECRQEHHLTPACVEQSESLPTALQARAPRLVLALWPSGLFRSEGPLWRTSWVAGVRARSR